MTENQSRMEYKNFRFEDTKSGRKKCDQTIQQYSAEGWTVQSRQVNKEKFNAGKGCCLGLLFLPLVLFGRGKTHIDLTMQREVPSKPAAKK